MEEIARTVACLAVLIFPVYLYMGSKVRRPTTRRASKPRRMSRAEREADLRREYGGLVVPRNAKQAVHFARIDAQASRHNAEQDNRNYIEHMAANPQREVWYDGDDNKHWRETVIDMHGNEVTVFSSDGNGLLD